MALIIVGHSIIWAHWQWGNLRLFSLVFSSVRWDPLYCISVDYSYFCFPLCQSVWLCNLYSTHGLPLQQKSLFIRGPAIILHVKVTIGAFGIGDSCQGTAGSSLYFLLLFPFLLFPCLFSFSISPYIAVSISFPVAGWLMSLRSSYIVSCWGKEIH